MFPVFACARLSRARTAQSWFPHPIIKTVGKSGQISLGKAMAGMGFWVRWRTDASVRDG
jgi:hypothetical protein